MWSLFNLECYYHRSILKIVGVTFSIRLNVRQDHVYTDDQFSFTKNLKIFWANLQATIACLDIYLTVLIHQVIYCPNRLDLKDLQYSGKHWINFLQLDFH